MAPRPAILAAAACLLAAAAAPITPTAARASEDPPAWEPVGPDGIAATDLLWDERHHHALFLATADGYWLYDMPTAQWTSFAEPGVPGRALTAMAGVPRLDHRVLTGRTDPDGHGTLEVSFPLRRDQVVYAGAAGPVSDLAFTGWFEPLGLACTRALGATDGELVASADTGNTWQPLAGHGHRDLTDLLVWSPQEWYVAGDAGVAYTDDGGQTWHDRSTGLPPGTVAALLELGPIILVPGTAPDAPASGEAAAATAPGRDTFPWLLAAMDDGVYFTATAPVAWQRVLATTGAPRQLLVQLDPWGQQDDLFVVTPDGGLLRAVVGAWDWTDWAGDLAGEEILGVVSHPEDLYVATATGGVFRTDYPLGGPSDAPPPAPALTLHAAPSPFNPRTVLHFTVPVAGHARLAVHDLRGRRVATLLDGPVTAGPHAVTWQPRGLASGVYVVRLAVGDRTARRPVALVR